MPITAENKARYPADWKRRSHFVRHFRAQERCESCGVHNHAVGWREGGEFFGLPDHPAGIGRHYLEDRMLTYSEARDVAKAYMEAMERNHWSCESERLIVIVLTCAHVHNPDPAAANLLNLAALCQRCHNILDAPMRAENRRRTLALKSPNGDLFDVQLRAHCG